MKVELEEFDLLEASKNKPLSAITKDDFKTDARLALRLFGWAFFIRYNQRTGKEEVTTVYDRK